MSETNQDDSVGDDYMDTFFKVFFTGLTILIIVGVGCLSYLMITMTLGGT